MKQTQKGLNFRFLNRFAGQKVGVVMKCDAHYEAGGIQERIEKGRLFGENDYMKISLGIGLHEPKHKNGELRTLSGCQFWTTRPHAGAASLPYLGATKTVWQINLLDGKPLFYHSQTGDDTYDIIGIKGNKIGELRGLTFPYKTPYDACKAILRGGNHNLPNNVQEMLEWRARILALV